MVQALSERIVTYAVRNNFLKSDQYEEYSYALNLVLNIFFTDITLILIGIIMSMIWECVVFWLLYKVLRKYCGGYHFSTSLRCYLSSCVMCPIVLLVIRYVPYNIWLWSIAMTAAAVTLLVLSPVPALNKPLDEKETELFGRVAKILTLAVTLFYIVMVIFNFYGMAKIISLSVVCVMIFVVVGKLALCGKKSF